MPVVFALLIVSISHSNIPQSDPGSTQQPGPGSLSKIVSSAVELSSTGWLQRSSLQQLMMFTAKTVAERTTPGQSQTIDEAEFTVLVMRPLIHPLASVIVTSKDYPISTAKICAATLLSEFQLFFPSIPSDKADWPRLNTYLTEWQTASSVKTPTKMSEIQRALDETTDTMHKNIEAVLRRGENLDSLMEKTEELDRSTKLFYKTAKQVNRRCCVIQ